MDRYEPIKEYARDKSYVYEGMLKDLEYQRNQILSSLDYESMFKESLLRKLDEEIQKRRTIYYRERYDRRRWLKLNTTVTL